MEDDQYQVECVALSDRNFNLACETGIRYPSLVAMLNCASMLWRMTVMYHDVFVYACMNCKQTGTSQYVLSIYSDISVMNRLQQEIVLVEAWLCMLGHQPSEANQG